MGHRPNTLRVSELLGRRSTWAPVAVRQEKLTASNIHNGMKTQTSVIGVYSANTAWQHVSTTH
jgi:hypothetical protein